MAYIQNPGRGPMMKTGRGIPDGFKQIGNPTDEEKVKADKEAAEARALEKAKQQQLEAGSNTGRSSNRRKFTGTDEYIIEGKKVERLASTPEEIKKWKEAPEENKKKYKDRTIPVSISVSDLGKDPKQTPTINTNTNITGTITPVDTRPPLPRGFSTKTTTKKNPVVKGVKKLTKAFEDATSGNAFNNGGKKVKGCRGSLAGK